MVFVFDCIFLLHNIVYIAKLWAISRGEQVSAALKCFALYHDENANILLPLKIGN